MGLIGNIRGFLLGSRDTQAAKVQENDEYEKLTLAERIVGLVYKIKTINTFDSSIWNLSNVSIYDLQRRSLEELQRLNSSLENRLVELHKQKEREKSNPQREALEASKWTGKKPEYMSDKDFDRFQRSDDSR